MSAQRTIALALIFWALLPGKQVGAQPSCTPEIAVANVQFSDMMNLRRSWSATVNVDASACSTSSGLFAFGFVRLSESAPDLEFAKPFIWRPGQMSVRVEFWADEAVERYWIADVATCPCSGK